MRVIGDPQTSLERFMRVLDAHGLLGEDGWLAEDVRLVSAGDHFDYKPEDDSDPSTDGVAVLRWLAAHNAGQVIILFGNHDAARVMELATISDERFAVARRLGQELGALEREQPEVYARRLREEFHGGFPEVPTPGLAARDFSSFNEEQRALVRELLVRGRFRLAASGALEDGREVLLTHAGCTVRELRHLGLEASASAGEIARALDRLLEGAVAEVRKAWQAGRAVALDLGPIHVPGAQPEEGGGLLYHRPASRDRRGADATWEFAAERPRRFEPYSLPAGLLQVCGHTGHSKCRVELEPWVTPEARAVERGVLRTLRVEDGKVVYDVGIAPRSGATAADLYLVDAEMNHVEPEQYPLLALDSVT